MTAESRTTTRIGDQIPDLPERRLLIVRELDDFTTGGIMRWTPELVEAFMAWSDFGTRAPGTYRIAFVSQTLTTEQVRGGKNGHAFTDVLQAWNVARHEEDRLKLIVQYGDTSACYLDGKYRNDGSDRVGIIEFFTSEFFGRASGSNALDRRLGGWHKILERSLRSHHIAVTNWMPHGNHPEDWLQAGFVHQGDAYRHVVLLDRMTNGNLAYKCMPVSRAIVQSERAE